MKNKWLMLIASVVIVLGLILTGCKGWETSPSSAPEHEQIVAATGSPFELGLVTELTKAFEEKTGCVVRCVKTPTGPGLDLGRHGMTHITIGHNPQATDKFVKDGHAAKRTPLMHNYTIIIGPADDPAEIKGLTDLEQVHEKIFDSNAEYLSRGDGGGMHMLELRTWNELGKDPSGKDWYRVSSKFMLDSLLEADANGEYHMLDSSTWTMHKSKIKNAELLVQGPPNEYEMCLVNTEKHPNVKYNQEFAQQFYDFLISNEGQKIIATFGVSEYGEPLYYPDVIKNPR